MSTIGIGSLFDSHYPPQVSLRGEPFAAAALQSSSILCVPMQALLGLNPLLSNYAAETLVGLLHQQCLATSPDDTYPFLDALGGVIEDVCSSKPVSLLNVLDSLCSRSGSQRAPVDAFTKYAVGRHCAHWHLLIRLLLQSHRWE